jgi:arylsulfatase A-like enzyme
MLAPRFVIPFMLFCAALMPAAERPNIVILLADDCGYHEFSLMGNQKVPTPHIDSIAANGVRFAQGYISGSVCSPSRAGLLTGRYQQRFGHEYNIPPTYSEQNGLPTNPVLLPAALKPAGYRTIALGKWHLGYAPKFHPLERGFDDYFGFLQGQRSYFPLDKPSRLNQLLRDREPLAKESFDYMTDELARQATQYIERHKASPFFMYLAFNATHGPIQATKEDLAKAEGNKIAAMTIALDRAVGNVLDCLTKQGLRERTLVVFLVDNGGATGRDNTPLRDHKGSSFEGGIRTPFVMQMPGVIPAGTTYPHPVIALDLFATSLALAGIDHPPGAALDGCDLMPYITGKKAERPHQTLYWKMGGSWAVRDGDLKLTVGSAKSTADAKPALFDLATDPSESTDLATQRPADVERMLKLYQTWKSTHLPTPWGKNVEEDEDP